MKRLATISTILLGMLLVAVITPLSQFLTIATVNADIETSTPVGWAVGLVFSLVLVIAAVRALARFRMVSQRNIVLLYVMLTIAVPVMNLGLVRQCYTTMCAVANEYLFYGTSTYRTAYNVQKPEWFPVAPTPEGLAWNKADRLLSLLRDDAVVKRRDAAQRKVSSAILLEARRLQRAQDSTSEIDTEGLKSSISLLGPDAAAAVLDLKKEDAARSLGIQEALETRLTEASLESSAAVELLSGELKAFDEYEASLLPSNLEKIDRSSRDRLDRELQRLSPEERARLTGRVDAVAARETEFRAAVTSLSEADAVALRDVLKNHTLASHGALSTSEYAGTRASFVYRITRNERARLIRQDGAEGTPNENLSGFFTSLWDDVASRKAKDERATSENVRELLARLPWRLWIRPILSWSALFLVIFLFMMCLAEWLRKKWVDRENLAFPLVEIADNIIRHDCELESAEDPLHPPARSMQFSPVFAVGILLGLIVISLEAAGHYGITQTQYTMFFDVSDKLFTTGMLKLMDKVRFVISPIVVGICFLVSLEVSFSIWATYWIYEFIVAAVKMVNPEIKDSLYTGWAGGRNYPFPMEQMLGACLCFAAVLCIKAWRSKKHVGPDHEVESEPYIPKLLFRTGLVALPVAAIGLMWNSGVTNIPVLLFFAVIALAITIAAARVRAETGLHTHHVTYEFTKVPMVFGMTGMTGAKVYASMISLAYLPITLLFRMLPQQLENLELARRHRIKYRTVAVASLAAFLVAVGVGMISLLLFSYYFGESAYGGTVIAPAANPNSFQLARYPLWVSHFLGENGLDKFTQIHGIRLWFMGIGCATFGLLLFLRGRFLRFPLHPVGYILVLLSIFYHGVSSYTRGVGGPAGGKLKDVCVIWGSALVAWLIKKLLIKYGGMNTYKKTKPLFIGLVVGSIMAVFLWNIFDLVCSIVGNGVDDPSTLVKYFLEVIPYSPTVY